MSDSVFKGVCTALVTPFLDDKINYPLMEQLICRQIDAGVPAVVLSGTTGESPTLSDYEKTELFRRAKAYAGSHCKIIAGTGTNSTAHAVTLSQAAEKAGVDALLVVSPYYNKGNADGLYQHYEAIAQSVSLPIIMYNVPTRTGIDIPISVYKKLSKYPNIVGVKEACPDITKIPRILNSCGKDFNIWTGNDDQIVPVTALGGIGVVSVISNILPEETIAMTQATLNGDLKTAAMLQSQLMPLIELLFCEVNPIPVKYAMRHIGFDCGSCRLPLGQLSDEHKKQIDRFFS
ncbi:MAG: 4-hydroxy-tetrahydrodipicolinate synthase [Oscillospiraceae bacterium]|nr:4-hydroxy-tetrahydrodipicolinate synthase [Oscillospiraceae bacterium]